MHALSFLWNRLRGRPSVARVQLLGRPVFLSVEALRELRRAKDVVDEEPFLLRILAHLRTGDVVYDIGANIGIVSMLMGTHPGVALRRIHSFEPEPRNHRQLLRNAELNGLEVLLKGHPMAVGASCGEIELFVRGGPGEGRHSTVARKGSTGVIRVPLTSVAAFAAERGEDPDLVKIDVEGAEGRVLAGMAPLLARGRPRDLFMEYHQKGEGDRMPDGSRMTPWLEAQGYTLVWERPLRTGAHVHFQRSGGEG